MQQRITVILIALFVFILSFNVHSDELKGYQAMELKYKSQCKKDGTLSSIKKYNQALEKAKINALRTWAARQSVAKSSLFAQKEDEIIQNIDEYFLNVSPRSSCEGKTFKISVKGLVDKKKIALLANANQIVAGRKGSRMVAIFMARKAENVFVTEDKVTKVNQVSSFSEGADSSTISSTSASSEGYSTTKKIKQSGGSTKITSDKINWSVYRSNGVSSAVREILSSYGFRVIKPAQITKKDYRFNPDAFIEDFSSSNGLSVDTEADATDALQALRVPLFVIGTLDVGQKQIDSSNGLYRINATVTAEVQYLDDGWWESVASVRPTLYAANGTTEVEAETNALIKAAEAAANEIVQQLNAAGIN